MNLSDLTADHIGHLVTIQAERGPANGDGHPAEAVRYVGILESFTLIWGEGVLAGVTLRVSGTVETLTTLRNGTLEDYTVKVGR